MALAEIIKFLVAIIVMMNPLGSLSIYLQLMRHAPAAFKRQTALKCGVAISVIMIVSILIGKQVLDLLGITLPAFRFAGGIILLLIGLSMLQSNDQCLTEIAEDARIEKRECVAIVPLGLPIIVGPGVLSTIILRTSDAANIYHKLILCLLSLLLSIAMTTILYYGSTIAKYVGESTIKVITRIMGMLTMAIASSMLANGLIGLIPALQ